MEWGTNLKSNRLASNRFLSFFNKKCFNIGMIKILSYIAILLFNHNRL